MSNDTHYPTVVIVGLPTIRELLKGNNVDSGNAILIPDSNVKNESFTQVTLRDSEFIPINIGPIPKQLVEFHDMEDLVTLISWAVNGPEHGVLTASKHKEICKNLLLKLKEKGYHPHGQWTIE